MFFFLYCSFLLLVISVNFYVHRDVLHPIAISCSVWLILTLLYRYLCTTSNRYRVLSDKFYLSLLIYFIPFIFFTVFSVGNVLSGKKYNRKIPILSLNHEVYIKNLISLCIIFNTLLILRLCMICHSFNILYVVTEFREIVVERPYLLSPDIKLLLYLYNFTPPVICYMYLCKIKVKRIKKIVLIIGFLIIAILYASKGRLMKYFVMIFLILYLRKKLNIKIFILIASLMLLIIYSMTMSRDQNFFKNYTLIEYIYVYLLSPLPAFDMLLCGEIPFTSSPFGGRALSFCYRVGAKLFGIRMPTYESMFIMIPSKTGFVPTNVFTCFGNSYMDFGYIGILLFGVFSAIAFGGLYRLAFYSRRFEFKIVYMLLVYCLIFQFFGDFLFSFLSMSLQDIICTLIIEKQVRIGVNND